MLATINRLQLLLFHYVFAYEVMKERAEEAEKQAEHLGTMLARVLGDASVLEESVARLIEELDHDENQCGGKQPPCTSNGRSSEDAAVGTKA